LARVEFGSGTDLVVLPLSFVRLENHVCLSHGVQIACAAIERPGDVQRTGDGRTGRVLGGRVIERPGDAVCGLHHARGDEEREFLV
jgi:hypothetical protein